MEWPWIRTVMDTWAEKKRWRSRIATHYSSAQKVFRLDVQIIYYALLFLWIRALPSHTENLPSRSEKNHNRTRFFIHAVVFQLDHDRHLIWTTIHSILVTCRPTYRFLLRAEDWLGDNRARPSVRPWCEFLNSHLPWPLQAEDFHQIHATSFEILCLLRVLSCFPKISFVIVLHHKRCKNHCKMNSNFLRNERFEVFPWQWNLTLFTSCPSANSGQLPFPFGV